MPLPLLPVKPTQFMGSAREDLSELPPEVKLEFGHAIFMAQVGGMHPAAKPLRGDAAFKSATAIDRLGLTPRRTIRALTSSWSTHMTDHKITAGSGNIFADIGVPNAEEHLFKAHIVAVIDASIKGQCLTQAAAGLRMGLSQPDVSKILRGRYEGFSVDRLLACLRALGHDVTVAISAANENAEPGHLHLAYV